MTLCPIALPRPGGIELTGYAAKYFPPNADLIDIGCGSGVTVGYLNGQKFRAVGVDCDERALQAAESAAPGCFVFAGAHSLPFLDEKFDGALFECSLSTIDSPELALSEAFRVLKPGGLLLISDFFALFDEYEPSGVLGRIEKMDSIAARAELAGFRIKTIEDRSDSLRQLWGQMIFDMGRRCLLELLQADDQIFGSCGYFLLIAEKNMAG